MSRYARQMILPEVGASGQDRLARAHVLVVGAGGLGCPALQYLAAAGVGHITIVDPDVVAESNLHRQPLYSTSSTGQPKVVAAVEALHRLNPTVELHPIHAPLTPANATDLIAKADVVLDAADSFAVSYTLSDTCKVQGKPLVSASALGLYGYVGAFCGATPSLRAVFPDLPEHTASCDTAGVLGPLVGSIGCLQAQIALQILLQLTPSPLGRLLTLDMAGLSLGGFEFSTAEEPTTAFPFVATSHLDAADQVVDLRGAEEAPHTVTPTAMRMLPSEMDPSSFDQNRRIVLCCRSGLRAWRAANQLHAAGLSNIALLAVGDPAWPA